MFNAKPSRPYFDAWLRRAGRQLAVSGRLSEVAMLLATQDGDPAETWRARLRDLLEGDEQPSLELLTRIDALLAPPPPDASNATAQGSLF